MKMGIAGAGIGTCASADVIRDAARAAEATGFSTFWLPDHVLFFTAYPHSSYSYGDLHKDSPVPDPYTPLADPVVAMTWVAAATSRIEIGTSILILPERNPVVLAKEIGTLDAFSGGRILLGLGVGWSREEYEAVGADWTKRGRRMDEYVALMRTLWRDPVASFRGESFALDNACLNPKPVRGDVPMVFGGESEAALRRIARVGQGWLPGKLPLEDAAAQIAHLKDLTRAEGRDPEALRIIGPAFGEPGVDELCRYRDAGVTEFYLGVRPPAPDEVAALPDRIARLADKYLATVGDW